EIAILRLHCRIGGQTVPRIRLPERRFRTGHGRPDMMSAEKWSAEIDASLSHRSQAQVANVLQQITDWFLQGASTLSEEHVAIFDDVMGRLIERIEHEALVELSERLAPIGNAPAGVIGTLSRNDDIAVSGPV